MLQKLAQKSVSQLQFLVVLLAIFIAAQVQYIQHGWINPDSTLYLTAAKFFSNGDWKAGIEVFRWPFYALCITAVNKITQLGVHVSAQILNVCFFAIASYGFIQIIQLAGGKQRQIIAGALIWLGAQYMIGDILGMLMRDEGFWAFFLLGIVFFIRFYQQHQLKDALLWQVCIIVATLFRIEAILYLMFLPLILLSQSGINTQQKIRHLLSAHAINISLAIAIVLIFTLNGHLSTQLLGRLNEVFTTNLWQQFAQNLTKKSAIMSKQVLGEYLNEFAVQGLLLTFVYVIVVKTISATGLVNMILSTLAIHKNKQLMQQDAFRVLRATALIALLNMALIITKVFVLSSRYVLALSFILMIFAAFYFAELLFNAPKNKKVKWIVIAILVLILGGALKNVWPKREGYNYQQDAVKWLEQHNAKQLHVFYDDTRLRYYAGQPITYDQIEQEVRFDDLIKSNAYEQYEFIVLTHHEKQPQYILKASKTLTKYSELKRFYDAKKRKYTIIYRKKN